MKDVQNSAPLVSLLILTYNFERYVGDAVRAAFAQTYPNLEIVISDDCSTDGTWNVIETLVNEYALSDGRHRVVLNRNSRNLGVIRQYEFSQTLCHGELIFYNDGDDVSHPRRVEETVAYWERENRRPWVVFSGALKVDREGHCIGELFERPDNEGILGIAAYRRGMDVLFGSIAVESAVTDEIYGNRALMLGPRGSISAPLMKYRIGSGESSGYRDYRRRRAWVLKHREDGAQKQLLKDVETIKSRLGPGKYEEWKQRIQHKQRTNAGMLELLEGNSFAVRLRGLRKLDYRKSVGQRILYAILLLPHGLADVVLAVGARCWDLMVSFRRKPCDW